MSGQPPGEKRKRKILDWVKQCHKLLASMRELDDSEHFRYPVDNLKYPLYHNIVESHMDLSHVQLKLHKNLYPTPQEFNNDIRLIFDNWKLFCKDPKKHYQIYQAVHKLSWWFENEFGKIMNGWNQHQGPSPSKKQRVSGGTVSSSPNSCSEATASSSNPRPNGQKQQFIPTRSGPGTDGNRVPVQNGFSSIFQGNQNRPNSATSPRENVPSGSDTSIPRSNSTLETGVPQNENSRGTSELAMESTSLWFGPCRSKQRRPVLFNENGFTIYLNGQDNQEHQFVIYGSDIVRSCGHLGKNGKHTLFIFITPLCEKRLKEIAVNHQVFATKPDKEPCSVIAIFIKSLDDDKIGRLVYLFWCLSRNSIFGQLFSEVDQKGALNILSNIKPQIMGRVHARVAETVAQRTTVASHTISPRTDNAASTASQIRAPEPTRILEPPASPEPSEKGTMPNRTSNLIARSGTVASRPKNNTSTSPSIHPENLNQIRGSTFGQNIHGANSSVSNLKQTTGTFLFSSQPGASRLLPQSTTYNPSSSRESPMSPPPERNLQSDDDDLAIIECPAVTSFSVLASRPVTIQDGSDDIMIAEEHSSIKCPITQQVMSNPMRNIHCRHNYDRVGVMQLILNRGSKARCPVPGCSNPNPLDMHNMEDDHEMAQFITSRK